MPARRSQVRRQNADLDVDRSRLPEGGAADATTPTVRKPPTPFPTLIVDAPERWHWPVPPIAWRHVPAPSNDVPQPCRLERKSGSVIEGDMLGFDPEARMLTFRTTLDGPRVELAFSRFCRLTLTTPLKPAPRMVNAPIERVPAAAQERDYTLHSDDVTPPLTGRTASHVETSDGVYLFTPVNEEAALQRVFVPRSAYTRREFGPSAEEVATSRGHRTHSSGLHGGKHAVPGSGEHNRGKLTGHKRRWPVRPGFPGGNASYTPIVSIESGGALMYSRYRICLATFACCSLPSRWLRCANRRPPCLRGW